MPGAYNVVPDDAIRLSVLNRLIGVKFAPTVPVWLARLVTDIRWRYFGSNIHPSWVDITLIDATVTNTKLKSTGWRPRYICEAAIRAAR
jgi:UDP-glucose 4-epimerase